MRYEHLSKELKIDSFEASVVDIPMKVPMHLAFGDITSRPSGVARLEISDASGRKFVGLGEGATLPQPVFTDDSGENIQTNIQALLREVSVGTNVTTCADLIERVQNYAFGDGIYPTARMAVEMALLDANSRLSGIAIAEMLGIEDVTSVPYGKSIGGYHAQDIVSQATTAVGSGASKVKLKAMPDNFDDVIKAIHEIRTRFGDIGLMVDANGGFDPTDDEHIDMLRALDDESLLMIEEPVSRKGKIRGLAAVELLRDTMGDIATPICLDDCLDSYQVCLDAVGKGLADIINIKPGRIGSILRSISLIDHCEEIGKQVMIGGMFEATPGRCMTTILGAYCVSKGFTIPGDLSLAQERLLGDIPENVRELRYNEAGEIEMPTGLGWGYSNG